MCAAAAAVRRGGEGAEEEEEKTEFLKALRGPRRDSVLELVRTCQARLGNFERDATEAKVGGGGRKKLLLESRRGLLLLPLLL